MADEAGLKQRINDDMKAAMKSGDTLRRDTLRMLGAAIEQNHDEKGIIWPASIAPFQVHLCPLYREGTQVAEEAENLYRALTAAGLEVLIDDREESPGVKFNDAGLLGMPVRVTVSPRSLEKNSIEVKRRPVKEFDLLPLEEAVDAVKKMVEEEVGAS